MELIDQLGLTEIYGTSNKERLADVIFVHGLDGGSHTTWAANHDPSKFWPLWLGSEFPDLGFWTLGYGTSKSAWQDHSMPIVDLGNQILEELYCYEIGKKSVIFVAYSMGGLVVKQILCDANSTGVDRWNKICEKTRGIAFIATPHYGANIASFASFASIVLKTSEQVCDLEQHSARLRNLHGKFLTLSDKQKLICRSYAERREVKAGFKILKKDVTLPKGILVVDATSSEPNIRNERAIPLDEDHISICKPENKKKQIYKYTRAFIRECLESLVNPK